jgi:hypothetical protein
MLRIILKLWPALLPVVIYCLWILVIKKLLLQKILRKKDEINGEKIVGEASTEQKKPKAFSLQNRSFVAILYFSLVLAILLLIRLGV